MRDDSVSDNKAGYNCYDNSCSVNNSSCVILWLIRLDNTRAAYNAICLIVGSSGNVRFKLIIIQRYYRVIVCIGRGWGILGSDSSFRDLATGYI